MTTHAPLQGELQMQVMAALWRIEGGSVEDVRAGLPSRYRGAYTTVQTVLNRLAERGLLARHKRGRVVIYTPTVSEADYLSGAIEQTLAGASREARQAALARLIGGADESEISDLRRLAREIDEQRSERR